MPAPDLHPKPSPFVRLFQSPSNSGGNDGANPVAYDPKWQFFTNLTRSQIDWFQAQPGWANFVSVVRANQE